MPRVSATIDDGVFERMEKYRGEINFSKVFKDAVPDMVADAIRGIEDKKKAMKREAKIVRDHMDLLAIEIRERVVLTVKSNGIVPDQEFDFRPPSEKC